MYICVCSLAAWHDACVNARRGMALGPGPTKVSFRLALRAGDGKSGTKLCHIVLRRVVSRFHLQWLASDSRDGASACTWYHVVVLSGGVAYIDTYGP